MSDLEGDRIIEAKIIVTVLGEAETPEAFAAELSNARLSEIGSAMNNGDLIGSIGTPIVEAVDPGQVKHRLEAVGNDGSFFDLCDDELPKGAPREDAAGKILRTQMEQGWSTETLEMLGRDFLESCGLSHAFAEFLERRAGEENDMSADFEEGGM